MKSRVTLPLVVLGLLLVLFACSSMDTDTLATIGSKTISLDEFTSKNPASRFAEKDHEFINGKVDEFVRKALFTQVALDRGLDQEEAIQQKRETAERRQMLQYVYDRAILGEVISDEYLKELFDRSGTELKARHILIQHNGTERSRSERTKVEALALMGQIKNRLAGGEEFIDLATEFSEDPSGKSNGGDLGWFSWGKMVGPFQDAAFSLEPGEISNVVETAFGFHIIKLDAKREVERGSFEDEKTALKNQARKEKGPELGRMANQFIEEQKQAAGFKLNTENIHDFFMVFEKSAYKQGTMDDIFKKVAFPAPLFELKGEELGGEWIVGELKSLDEGQKPRFTSENQLLTILDQLVTQTLIVGFGFENDYARDEDFSAKINVMVERYAYDAFVDQEVNQNLNPTEEELLAFYESNKDAKYLEKEKVQVREIFVKDSLLAVDLKKRVDAGEMFDLLAGRYTERKASKEKRGELPAFQEGRYGLMGKKAFTLQKDEVAGPIKLGNGYSIIKLEKSIPEGPKPYSKVKGRVRTEIIGDLRTGRVDAIYTELTKEYPVKINYEAVHNFYASSENK